MAANKKRAFLFSQHYFYTIYIFVHTICFMRKVSIFY